MKKGTKIHRKYLQEREMVSLFAKCSECGRSLTGTEELHGSKCATCILISKGVFVADRFKVDHSAAIKKTLADWAEEKEFVPEEKEFNYVGEIYKYCVYLEGDIYPKIRITKSGKLLYHQDHITTPEGEEVLIYLFDNDLKKQKNA